MYLKVDMGFNAGAFIIFLILAASYPFAWFYVFACPLYIGLAYVLMGKLERVITIIDEVNAEAFAVAVSGQVGPEQAVPVATYPLAHIDAV